jgi:hypothetical protein
MLQVVGALKWDHPKPTQSDKAVPSSAHWNPTNPLRSKHQKLADVKAVNPAVKYWQCGTEGQSTKWDHLPAQFKLTG